MCSFHESDSEARIGSTKSNQSRFPDAQNNSACTTSPDHRYIELQGQKRKYTFIDRQQAQRRTRGKQGQKRKQKLKRVREILESNWECCKRTRCVKVIDPVLSAAKNAEFAKLSNYERKIRLLGMLDNKKKFRFEGYRICNNYIKEVLCFSDSLIGAVVKRRSARAESTPHPSPRYRNAETMKEAIIVFLGIYADRVGDHLPHKNKIRLPQHQKKDVYEIFRKECLAKNDQGAQGSVATLAYFCRIWKHWCENILPRSHHMFTKCDTCEFLREESEKISLNLNGCAQLAEQKRRHWNFVQSERLEYAKKRDLSSREPHTYCSIIIDGADQTAYGLPHFVHRTKSMRGEPMKVRLIGIKEHLSDPRIMLFLLTEEHETGANHIIESIHRFLENKRLRGRIPKVFYVQADNCTRENKNRYTLGYLQMLVARGVFQEVQVSFLPVGHTHEDIDQVFSRTSCRLRNHSATTLEKLSEELATAYSPRPSVTRMKEVANFSGLCESERCLYNLPAWTHMRYFRFAVSDIQDQGDFFSTVCHAKVDCKDEWFLFNEGRGFLDSIPELKRTPPTISRCPENLGEVNKYLSSAQERVRSVQEMRELYKLRDDVYRSKIEQFHWGSDIVELQGQFLRKNQHFEHEHVEDELEEPDLNDVLNHSYEYKIGEMVAVHAGDDQFWIAEIVKVRKDKYSVPSHLQVQWYEACGVKQTDQYAASYKPAMLSKGSGRTKAREPWKDEVSTNTILVCFEKLNSNRKLPALVAKRIRETQR